MEEIEILAEARVVKPNTQMETEDGQKLLARQMSGLNFERLILEDIHKSVKTIANVCVIFIFCLIWLLIISIFR